MPSIRFNRIRVRQVLNIQAKQIWSKKGATLFTITKTNTRFSMPVELCFHHKARQAPRTLKIKKSNQIM